MLEPRHDPRVDTRVLELREQLEEQHRVALVGCESERAFRTIERTQAGLTGQHARQRRLLGRDENPMLAAAVATKLDVVALITIADCRPLAVCGAPRQLRVGAVREESATGGIGEPQARGSRAQLSDELRGPIVDRKERAADRGQAAGLRVLEQLSYGFGRSIGGEAEPPVLVGPREIEQALICATSRPPAPDRAGERLTHLGLAGKARQQARERLGLLGFERETPDTLGRIPAAARDRAQEFAQALVVGKAQHGLAASHRG